MSFNHAFAASRLDLLGVCPLSEQQVYGSKDDAFAGARLACNHGKAGAESDVQFVDERKVLDVELL